MICPVAEHAPGHARYHCRMARRTGPGPRITEFARALGEHPMLAAAVYKVLMDTLPMIAAQLEAEERRAAAQPAALAVEQLTHWERQALRNAPARDLGGLIQ